jgi:hypothetical protein
MARSSSARQTAQKELILESGLADIDDAELVDRNVARTGIGRSVGNGARIESGKTEGVIEWTTLTQTRPSRRLSR